MRSTSVFFALLFVSTTAFGGDSLSLFREGRDALARGDVAVALEKFEASARLDEKVGTLLNLAECEERLDRLDAAKTHLDRAVALAETSNDDRLELAKGKQAALAKRLEPLPVAVASPTTPPPPPSKVVEVVRPAAEPIHVVASSKQRWVGYGVGGVGVLALATGTVFTVFALEDNATSNETCRANVCDVKGNAAREDARTWGNLATGFFIGGAVTAAVGALLVVLAPKTESSLRLTARGLGGSF